MTIERWYLQNSIHYHLQQSQVRSILTNHHNYQLYCYNTLLTHASLHSLQEELSWWLKWLDFHSEMWHSEVLEPWWLKNSLFDYTWPNQTDSTWSWQKTDRPKLVEAIPTTSSIAEQHEPPDCYSSSRVDDGHSLHNPKDSPKWEGLEELMLRHLDCSTRLSLDQQEERRGIDLIFGWSKANSNLSIQEHKNMKLLGIHLLQTRI